MKKLAIFLALVCAAAAAEAGDAPDVAVKGAPAPALALEDVVSGGPAIKGWGDLKGKAVVLEFWSASCKPCVANIPHLNELAAKFKDKPVVFISAGMDTRAETEAFLKTQAISGIVAAGVTNRTLKAFNGDGIPHTVLIDAQGRVAAFSYPSEVGPDTIEDLLAGRPVIVAHTVVNSAPESAASIAFFSVGAPSGAPSLSWGDNSIEASGFSLRYIIETAMLGVHGVDFSGAPDEVLDKEYSLTAKVPSIHGSPDYPRFLELFSAGINASFPLRLSVAKRTRNVYLLKDTGKPGPGLARAAGGRSRRSGDERSNAFIKAKGTHLEDLAKALEKWLGVPVLDETGLTGGYDYEFRTAVFDRKSVSDALTEKLGLKLEEASREVAVAEVTGLPAAPAAK